MTAQTLMFLCWESPWPAQSGGDLRTLGLLMEISKAYPVHLVVLSRKPLSQAQKTELANHVNSITRVPMAGAMQGDKIRILVRMLMHRMPYHCAVLDLSFQRAPHVLRQVRSLPDAVYASYGHWGTLVRGQKATNWILDQHNADIDFWRVYATQVRGLWRKLAALANWQLASTHFPRVYASVGRVVSVCESDRQSTLAVAPQAQVDVIENGVDCSYYFPRRATHTGPPRLLFTGTSAARNMTALHGFVKRALPLIRWQVLDVELLVGGNFSDRAQAEFAGVPNMRFTGPVDDMRPVFDQSDVFVAPFDETHGSKLKIAEAMAMAMPIVSTPQGVRGFPLVDGQSVLIANDAEEFSAHAVSFLRNPERRTSLGQSARQTALATIDWHVLGKRLVQIIETTQEQIMQGQERFQ